MATNPNLVNSISKAEAFKQVTEQRKNQNLQTNLMKTLINTNSNIMGYVSDIDDVTGNNFVNIDDSRKELELIKKSNNKLAGYAQKIEDGVNKLVDRSNDKIDLTQLNTTDEVVNSSVESLENSFNTYAKTKDPHGIGKDFKKTIGKVTSVILAKRAESKQAMLKQPKDFLRTDDNAMLDEVRLIRSDLSNLADKRSESNSNLLKLIGLGAGLYALWKGKGIGVSGLLKHLPRLYKFFAPKSLTKIASKMLKPIGATFKSLGDNVFKSLSKVASTLTKPIGSVFKTLGDNIFKPLAGFGKIAGTKLAGGLKSIIPKFGDDLIKTIGRVATKSGIAKGGKGVLKFGTKALKALPGIGTLVAIPFAINRFRKGDVVGGLIEMASGLASLDITGGLGTAASIALETYQISRDIRGGAFKKEQNKKLKSINVRELPLIGSIIQMKEGFGMWATDKVKAIKTFSRAALTMSPGGGFVFDAVSSIAESISNWGPIQTAKESVSETAQKLSPDMLRNLPVIGSVIQMKEGLDLWDTDRAKSLQLFGRAVATIVPGGGFLFDAAANLVSWVKSTDISSRIQSVAKDLTSTNDVWAGLKTGISGLLDNASGLLGTIKDKTEGIRERAKQIGIKTVKAAPGMTKRVLGTVTSSASKVFQASKTTLGAALSSKPSTGYTTSTANEAYEPGLVEVGPMKADTVGVKNSVNLSDLNLGPKHGGMENVILDSYQNVMGPGFQPVVTSARRDKSANAKAGSTDRSKHLVGQALDLRSNDSVMTASQGQKVTANLKNALGSDYGVLQHGSGGNRHIHMQYNGTSNESSTAVDVPASYDAQQKAPVLENAQFKRDVSDQEKMKNLSNFLINEFSNVMAQKIAAAVSKTTKPTPQGVAQPNPF